MRRRRSITLFLPLISSPTDVISTIIHIYIVCTTLAYSSMYMYHNHNNISDNNVHAKIPFDSDDRRQLSSFLCWLLPLFHCVPDATYSDRVVGTSNRGDTYSFYWVYFSHTYICILLFILLGNNSIVISQS
jgi:hypothetical protein